MIERRRFPLATALRDSLKAGYSLSLFKADLLSAFIVSLLALPLSMALAIAVGLPPQHGIYTAVVAGIVVPLLGGSPMQVSGPTAAFVVILAPIVAELGLRGIIWCQLLAGVILIGFGVARLGKLINYVPYPVTTGFTAGIAVVLATLSLNDFLGLEVKELSGSYIHKLMLLLEALPNFHAAEALVGMVSLAGIIFGGRITKTIPSPIIGILLGTALAYFLAQHGMSIDTIGSRFSYISPEGITLSGIPPYLPSFHLPGMDDGSGLWVFPTVAEWKKLVGPALTIAILAALESLLSATVADGLGGTKHNPNAELNGIGIGNILSGLVTGIPATGAIARTATNINNGAKTPFASSMHAALIMLYVWSLASYISYIPMASLAALLLYTAYRMSHVRQFIRTIEIAPRSDTLVLLTCFALTVLVDMVIGVSVGIVLAAFLLIKRVTELLHVELEGAASSSSDIELPHGVMIYHLRGPLFFANVEKAFDRYNFLHDYCHTLVIDMEQVSFIDMSGLVALKSMVAAIANEKRQVILCGAPDITSKIRKKIEDSGKSQFVTFAEKVDQALAFCNNRLKDKSS